MPNSARNIEVSYESIIIIVQNVLIGTTPPERVSFRLFLDFGILVTKLIGYILPLF